MSRVAPPEGTAWGPLWLRLQRGLEAELRDPPGHEGKL